MGGLFALTAEEEARIFDATTRRVIPLTVGPRTSYSVVRLKQGLGRNGSSVGMFVSAVTRAFDRLDPIADLYNRNAFPPGALDFTHRFKNRTYELSGNLGYTRVVGEPADIERLQRSSARYFQRPDATHVRLDPTRRTLDGGSGGLSLGEGEGRWVFEVATGFESAETERDDVGSLQTADGVFAFADVAYRQTKPGVFYRWETAALGERRGKLRGRNPESQHGSSASVTWRNYWETFMFVRLQGSAQDERLTHSDQHGHPTRMAPLPQSGEPRTEQQAAAGLRHCLRGDEDGGSRFSAGVTTGIQVNSRVRLSLNPTYSRAATARQYVDTLEGGRARGEPRPALRLHRSGRSDHPRRPIPSEPDSQTRPDP